MYLSNPYKNLYASISIPTEQLYLGIEGRFHLSKVSKLRREVLDEIKSSRINTISKNINSFIRTYPILTKIYMHVFQYLPNNLT